jgi:hypothetical protein
MILSKIESEIKKYLTGKILNYGEAHEIIVENQGANYVSIVGEKPCSVDDNYDLVLFFVREGSTPGETQGRGLKQIQFRFLIFHYLQIPNQ